MLPEIQILTHKSTGFFRDFFRQNDFFDKILTFATV